MESADEGPDGHIRGSPAHDHLVFSKGHASPFSTPYSGGWRRERREREATNKLSPCGYRGAQRTDSEDSSVVHVVQDSVALHKMCTGH
jgi:hypothetical protein